MSDEWDDFSAEVGKSSRSYVCGVAKYLADLPSDAPADLVETAIENTNASASAVRTALLKRTPLVPSAGIIRSHRRKECACYR